MKIVKAKNLDFEKLIFSLKQGKTFVYPTETCYGLGADALNEESVHKIFEIKKRQKDKSLLILVSDLSMIIDFIEWNPKLESLAEKYWPGPLTIVTKVKKDIFPKGVVAEDGTIAFRISKHPIVSEIIKKLAKPIISTSANVSSKENPYSILEIEKTFEKEIKKPDIIIDDGELVFHNPSTVVKVEKDKIIILRQGELIMK